MPQAKFVRELHPDQKAVVTMELRKASLHFVVTTGSATVAQGIFDVELEGSA